MTVESGYIPTTYNGNGVTTAFVLPFLVVDADDLIVTITSSSGVDAITTAYTVTGIGDDDGVTVTMNTPPASGEKLTIEIDPIAEQQTHFLKSGLFPSEDTEVALDRLTQIAQVHRAKIDRSIRAPDTDNNVDMELPTATVRASQYLVFDASGNPGIASGSGADSALRADLANTTTANKGNELVSYRKTAAEISAGVTPTNYFYTPQPFGSTNVFRYFSSAQIADVLSAGSAVDVTAAINTALSVESEVWCPDGYYRCDTTVVIPPGKKLSLSRGAQLTRVAAASATTPVVDIHGSLAELDGGAVATVKAHPSGIVRCGHQSTSDNIVALRWRLKNCVLTGQTSVTAGNIGIYIPSAQVTLGTSAPNYFGLIQNVSIEYADTGILFAEFANAHFGNSILFWHCKTSCLEFRGAGENSLSDLFFHQGTTNGLISILISNKTASTQESQFNSVIGFSSETGGAADLTLSIQANALRNKIIGHDNNAGAFNVLNLNNYVELNGIVRYCTDMQLDAVEVYGKAVFGSARNFGVVTVSRLGFIKSYNAANGVSLAVGSDFTIPDAINCARIYVRNASDGGFAELNFDSITGFSAVIGTVVVAGADPGAGAGKFWISNSGTSVFIRNRYVANKAYDILVIATS